MPQDVLRKLPIAKDWSDIADAASHNEQLRGWVNDDISAMWTSRTLKDKQRLKQWALSSRAEFEAFIEMVRSAKGKPYDIKGDPEGEVFWREIANTLAEKEPFKIDAPAKLDVDGVAAIVEKIIERFKFLIEKRRHSEDLYHNGKPRPEKAAQRLFFAIAYAYCEANDLDITPEADTEMDCRLQAIRRP